MRDTPSGDADFGARADKHTGAADPAAAPVNWRPHRKVAAAGTLGPALATFLVWVLPTLPQPVVGLIAAGVPVLVAYWTRERKPVQSEAPHS